MTHTPGPWAFDGVCQIVEVERPHMRVCFLPSDHHEYASSKSNGRLISAAPDLYAAVQSVIALREANWGKLAPMEPAAQAVFDQCLAAIAKAEGRSQGQPSPQQGAGNE